MEFIINVITELFPVKHMRKDDDVIFYVKVSKNKYWSKNYALEVVYDQRYRYSMYSYDLYLYTDELSNCYNIINNCNDSKMRYASRNRTHISSNMNILEMYKTLHDNLDKKLHTTTQYERDIKSLCDSV